MRKTKTELAEDLLKSVGTELIGIVKFGGKEMFKLAEDSASELGRFAVGAKPKKCGACQRKTKGCRYCGR